jgi:hypothetical protein
MRRHHDLPHPLGAPCELLFSEPEDEVLSKTQVVFIRYRYVNASVFNIF